MVVNPGVLSGLHASCPTIFRNWVRGASDNDTKRKGNFGQVSGLVGYSGGVTEAGRSRETSAFWNQNSFGNKVSAAVAEMRSATGPFGVSEANSPAAVS